MSRTAEKICCFHVFEVHTLGLPDSCLSAPVEDFVDCKCIDDNGVFNHPLEYKIFIFRGIKVSNNNRLLLRIAVFISVNDYTYLTFIVDTGCPNAIRICKESRERLKSLETDSGMKLRIGDEEFPVSNTEEGHEPLNILGLPVVEKFGMKVKKDFYILHKFPTCLNLPFHSDFTYIPEEESEEVAAIILDARKQASKLIREAKEEGEKVMKQTESAKKEAEEIKERTLKLKQDVGLEIAQMRKKAEEDLAEMRQKAENDVAVMRKQAEDVVAEMRKQNAGYLSSSIPECQNTNKTSLKAGAKSKAKNTSKSTSKKAALKALPKATGKIKK